MIVACFYSGLALLVSSGLSSASTLSPACQMATEKFCNESCADVVNKPSNSHCTGMGRAVIALKSGPVPEEWRCYAPGTLKDNSTWNGKLCYCSRDAELTQVLEKCGNPMPPPPPAPPPAPAMSQPAVPRIPSNFPSTAVFWRGQTASDGTVYPCIRIPAIINAKGVLLAFSECRRSTGDGCLPGTYRSGGQKDVCMRRSTDYGNTWEALNVIAKDAGQDTAVFDEVTGNVILQVNAAGGNAQLISPDLGLTWSNVSIIKGITQSSVGPGVGIQLSATNPHAPGRLLFIGHAGAYIQDYVWYSDDQGKTYTMATTSTGPSLLEMDEPQLVELANGVVMANMRNRLSNHSRGVSISKDGGETWGPIVFDEGLPTPVCMGSIIRSTSPLGDGNVYFANPGTTSGRVNGVVRQSTNCQGLPPDDCSWGEKPFEVYPGGGYAYSCLVPLNQTHVGLLWETNTTDCVGPSCFQVFTSIPIRVF
eukprot:m.110256 g.110256  ORF g.110256 m.110256 type:complete len:478 (-) comp28025_c0_seq3:584-2017(-)